MVKKAELIQSLIEAGRFMFDKGLAWGNAGNISARYDEETFYITASGTKLGQLAEEHLVPNRGGDNKRKPSKEAPVHEVIYRERPDIGAVLHSSPFNSTLIACSEINIESNLFVESMYYLEKVERVRYEHPGSQALAEAVREKAKKANILLLENHGILVYDKNVDEALVALQTLEMASKMIVTTMNEKINLKGLPKEVVSDFLENSNYKTRRKWRS